MCIRDSRYSVEENRLYMALHMVRTALHRRGRIQDCLRYDEQLGRKPWRYQLRPYRSRPDYPLLHLKNPGMHAQRSGGGDLPSGSMERIRYGQRGTGLPRMQGIRPAVQDYPLISLKGLFQEAWREASCLF